MLEDYLQVVLVFSWKMVDVELVRVVGEVLIVSLVLFVWLVSVLRRISMLGFVFFEIIGVIAWIVLYSLLRAIVWFILFLYSVGFIILLLKIIILMMNLLLCLYFVMLPATIISNIDIMINLFIILSLFFCFFFLLWLFCGIGEPFQEIYSFCVA